MNTIVGNEDSGAALAPSRFNAELPPRRPGFLQLVVRDRWFYLLNVVLLAYAGADWWAKGRPNEPLLIVCSINLAGRLVFTALISWMGRQEKVVAFVRQHVKLWRLLALRVSPLLVLGLIVALIAAMWLATNGWVGLT